MTRIAAVWKVPDNPSLIASQPGWMTHRKVMMNIRAISPGSMVLLELGNRHWLIRSVQVFMIKGNLLEHFSAKGMTQIWASTEISFWPWSPNWLEPSPLFERLSQIAFVATQTSAWSQWRVLSCLTASTASLANQHILSSSPLTHLMNVATIRVTQPSWKFWLMWPHMLHGSKSSSQVDPKLISNVSSMLSPVHHICHTIWLETEKPVLLCKLLPEASSIWWPHGGISTPLGLKNQISTQSSLRQMVFSYSLRLLFSPLRIVRTPLSLWRRLCKAQPVLAWNLYTDFIPTSYKHENCLKMPIFRRWLE